MGVAIAAPIGTVGVLCLRRLITNGGLDCLVSGLGAALADAIFATLAAFGLALVAGAISDYQTVIRVGSGLLVSGIGIRVFLTEPKPGECRTGAGGLARSFFSIFLLTISNPANILAIAAIMGALGVMSSVGGQSRYVAGAFLALGVFLGSASWWVVLGGLRSLFQFSIKEQRMVWVNRIGGAGLVILGIVLLVGIGIQPLGQAPAP